MEKPLASSYEEVPYPSEAYSDSNPDRLAALAVISGLTPPRVSQCRVLELACSDGGNLLPLAYAYPQSNFVGIDLSEAEIESGLKMVKHYGLENVQLLLADIAGLGPEIGTFDYIIAHGVYSWVPAAIQEKILQICHDHLNPNGVAYVSYNTLPGWHHFQVMRDFLLYSTRDSQSAELRIKKAREILERLGGLELLEDDLYGHMLRQISKMLDGMNNAYLYHDFMEDINEPIYVEEFIHRAAKQKMKYLGNADLIRDGEHKITENHVSMIVDYSSDALAQEQFSDFLINSTFRQTVLVRDDVELYDSFSHHCVPRLRIASFAQPTNSEFDFDPIVEIDFLSPDGQSKLTVPHPLTKAALLHLGRQWPNSVPFDELLTNATTILQKAEVPPPDDNDIELLQVNLFAAYGQSRGMLNFHTQEPNFTTERSARPTASVVARRYAIGRTNKLLNMRHQFVEADEMDRQLLMQLDGKNNVGALKNWLQEMQAEGKFQLPDLGQESIADALQYRLHRIARSALLVA